MKQFSFLLLLISPLFTGVSAVPAQSEGPTHATFSTFTTGRHSGHIFKVEKITSTGRCATVHFIEAFSLGVHTQALVNYEEHISIPIIEDEILTIDAINQFGERIDAFFLWNGKWFEQIICPLRLAEPANDFILYQSPGAHPIVNSSNRAHITPDNPAIAGIILNEPSWVIIRGTGPSLDPKENPISDPSITLHADQYLFDDFNDDLENSISNDNWQDTLRKDSLEYWQLAPANTLEAALVTYLSPGSYTAHLRSKDGSGIGIVEVYVAPYVLPPEDG